jgi:anti-sigma factor RsiW
MNRSLNACGHYRADLCLRASGALMDEGSAKVENHLATCGGCRKYYDEVKSVTAPLANWEKAFSHIEPNQTVQARWAKEFRAATEPVHQPRFGVSISVLDWCRDLIWPGRRIWAGFAATWLLILAVNFSTRDTTQSLPIKTSRPSPEMLRAFLRSEAFLAELTKTGESRMAEPPKPSLPTPRSERRPEISRG